MIPRLCIMFALGLATWLLVFLRSHSWDSGRVLWLSGVIFAEEALGICVGVWLARSGGLADIMAVAAGGTVAAAVAVRVFKQG
jgi:hypothetical protein